MHTCFRPPDPRWPTCPCGPAGAGWEVRIPGSPEQKGPGQPAQGTRVGGTRSLELLSRRLCSSRAPGAQTVHSCEGWRDARHPPWPAPAGCRPRAKLLPSTQLSPAGPGAPGASGSPLPHPCRWRGEATKPPTPRCCPRTLRRQPAAQGRLACPRLAAQQDRTKPVPETPGAPHGWGLGKPGHSGA